MPADIYTPAFAPGTLRNGFGSGSSGRRLYASRGDHISGSRPGTGTISRRAQFIMRRAHPQYPRTALGCWAPVASHLVSAAGASLCEQKPAWPRRVVRSSIIAQVPSFGSALRCSMRFQRLRSSVTSRSAAARISCIPKRCATRSTARASRSSRVTTKRRTTRTEAHNGQRKTPLMNAL
jgi:hypothetical protein